MGTKEYLTGSAQLADQLGCTKEYWDNVVSYQLPPEHGNSWIMEVHPAKGLFIVDAYFQLLEPVVREYHIAQPGLWLCSLSCGNIAITEKGKKARRLHPGIHLLVNSGQPFKMTFETREPLRYTACWLFDDFISSYFQARFPGMHFTSRDADDWVCLQYNTPAVLLVF